MSIGAYGLLIVFGAFILILIFNPNISCFGKRIKSPFYPLSRRRAQKKKILKTEDFGFTLADGDKIPRETKTPPPNPPTTSRGKPLVTEDFGFNLGDDETDKKSANAADKENNPEQEENSSE
jgi:hypothetical protein